MKIFKRFEDGTKDGGFEKACKYLLEHLGYKCQLTKDSADDGVDIVATRKDGTKVAFQCKNYQDDAKVDSPKIRDFHGALSLYNIKDGVFMTTSSFTSAAIKTAKELRIELWDYSEIKDKSNKLGFDLEALKPIQSKNLKSVVFEHNIPVYEKMEQMLNKTNKCLVTMGTGIGKTTTALEYLIRNNCRALIVCPTNIVKDGWKSNKSNKNGKLLDTITYSAFSKMYKDINYNNYGVIIFDEVHHGGAETWGAGIKYLMDNNIKVLGLTATEERTDGINVAESLFESNVVEGLDILGGIKEGIVYPFTYIGALYNAEQVCQAEKDKYGDKLNELLLGKLDMALNNTANVREIVKKDMPKGKRKGIIFSADVNSMDDDIKFIKEIYPNVEIKKLHSNMSYNEQKKVKQWFADAKSGYLCTIAMVNEGAHYDGVNTIFMLRKTTSELVFLQQLGRAITSVYGNSDPHTVVFDLVNSSKAIQNIKKKFKDTGVEEAVTPIELTDEQYNAVVDAINDGIINPIENDDNEIIEISTDDIPVLNKEKEINIVLEEAKTINKVKELKKTIYVKNKVEYNTSYGKSKQVIVKDYSRPIVEVIEELHNELDRRLWTEEEDDILKKWYPVEGSQIYKRFNNRTQSGCIHRASDLKIKGPEAVWSEEEDNIIRQYYSKEWGNVYKRLINRTKQACSERAAKLGVLANKLWLQEEDDMLRKYYPLEGGECFSRFEHRNKSAICQRAKVLDLKAPNFWSEEENKVFCKYYPIEGANVYKRLKNRTKEQCKAHASQLKIKVVKNSWTLEEDEILKQYYPIEGAKVVERLKNKSVSMCSHRAAKLNIQYIDNKWTEEEDEILKQFYPSEGKSVAKRLSNRTESACMNRALKWGLKLGYTYHVSNATKVICIETNQIFDTIEAANKFANCTTVGACVAGKQNIAGGYHWADYESYINFPEKYQNLFTPPHKNKQVKCVETGTIYYSINEAARQNKIFSQALRQCLSGKHKTAGGYHWEYIEGDV